MPLDVLLLRFDAPLMSFGGPMVDKYGVTLEHPPLSLVTGLLANALGWDHRDADRTQALQGRLRLAARRDRDGERVADFQTVDLGQHFMDGGKDGVGWTTRGAVEERRGGEASEGTHIRLRDYLADAVFTVALALAPPDGQPTVDDLARALDTPARPLFVGRKCCLPSTPLLLGRTTAAALRDALAAAPALGAARSTSAEDGTYLAWWPADDGGEGQTLVVTDERDWANQVHTGRRLVRQGRVSVAGASHV